MPAPADAVSPEQRAAIGRDYANSAIAVDAVCKRHRISRCTLYELREKEGWPHRQPERARAISHGCADRRLANPDGLSVDATGKRWHDGVLLARMRRMLASLIEVTARDIDEVRSASPPPRDMAEREQRTRLLNSLTRSLLDQRKLWGEIEQRVERLAARKAKKPDEQGHTRTLDEVRQEFARRLQAVYGAPETPEFPS